MIRILAFLIASPAFAQGLPCVTMAMMAETLADGYGETPLAAGLGPRAGQITTIWTSLATGTWTITVTGGDQTCMVMSGQGFGAVVPVPAGDMN